MQLIDFTLSSSQWATLVFKKKKKTQQKKKEQVHKNLTLNFFIKASTVGYSADCTSLKAAWK